MCFYFPPIKCFVLSLISFTKFNIPISLAAGVAPFTHLVEVMALTNFPLSSTVVATETAAINLSSIDSSTAAIALLFTFSYSIISLHAISFSVSFVGSI